MCSFDFSLGHHVTAENRNLVENTSRQNYRLICTEICSFCTWVSYKLKVWLVSILTLQPTMVKCKHRLHLQHLGPNIFYSAVWLFMCSSFCNYNNIRPCTVIVITAFYQWILLAISSMALTLDVGISVLALVYARWICLFHSEKLAFTQTNKKGNDKCIYIALILVVHARRSGMDHTVSPAITPMPAFTS